MSEGVKGVDGPAVTAWFEEHVAGARGPLEFTLIAGGHSNLTYGVRDAADRRYVLRRPPIGHVLATAHDMGREHKIISALGPTAVPVAPALGLCTDESVNGAPFYVMEFVDGHVLRDAEAAKAISVEARRNAGRSVASTLAKIHAIDPDTVGLGDLGKKQDYVARQLKRWYGQWEQSKTRELADIDDVYQALLSRIPEQGPAAIVHGDYRLDNCMTDDDGNVIAVLDWELCTLGDPLADVGLLAVYWTDPDEGSVLLTAPTHTEGFLRRQDVIDAYAEESGRDVSHIDYYVALGFWKLACIVEGVYARYVGGAMGSDGGNGFEGFRVQVEHCARQAAEAVGRLR